jgi:hypothetical protein
MEVFILYGSQELGRFEIAVLCLLQVGFVSDMMVLFKICNEKFGRMPCPGKNINC